FVQDSRHESPAAWIARVAPEQHWREGRGEEGTAHAGLAPDRDDQELLAGRDTFAKAVRDALKHFHVPDRLAKNPLLNSALVARRAGDRADSDSKARALQAVFCQDHPLFTPLLGTLTLNRVPRASAEGTRCLIQGGRGSG